MRELAAFAARFDPVFAETISAYHDRAAVMGKGADADRFIEYVASLAVGGKRVRPFMAWTMYEAGSGADPEVLHVLASLELFHLFALVHDDIMDQGTLRHGLPTAHVAFSRPPFDFPPRIASSLALLAGDLVFSWAGRAWDVLPTSVPAPAAARAKAAYNDMIDEVVAGQMLDVALTVAPEADVATVDRKTELKTAGYTFVRPMLIGAELAGATHLAPFCETFGMAVGRAFQTRDDLLDSNAPASQTAKTAFSDIAEGQHTVLTAHVFTHGTPADRDLLRACMGRGPLDAASAAEMRAMLERSGAYAAASARIDADLAQARALLDATTLPATTVSTLRSLCEYLAVRPS